MRVGRERMMDRTDDMLRLMEVGIGVREAVFVTTGILPLDVAESARADYERDIRAALRSLDGE
jgi:hypothetical protein